MNEQRRTLSILLGATLGLGTLPLAGCGIFDPDRDQDAGSGLMTDLGPGNETVAKTFAAYKAKSRGCSTSATSGKRVMITGFGLFDGADFNISGTVVDAMASWQFTNWKMDTAAGTAASPQPSTAWGRLSAADQGGRATNRRMRIDGEDYSVCLLKLDVLWDLAGAIVAHEMEQFKPDLVIMTGRGTGATFEGGAVNHARRLPGYRPSGASDPENQPADYNARILADGPESLPMTWSNSKLLAAAESRLGTLGQTAEAAGAARPSNDYICNNVSYIALAAQKGLRLDLAGGRIPAWTPKIGDSAKIGFFHYPHNAKRTREELSSWVRLLGKMIVTELK